VLHHAKPGKELLREEDQLLPEDAICVLQCGDSLAIAANRIGEDVFGVKKLLLRTLRALGRR
jgi:hypothetical protein